MAARRLLAVMLIFLAISTVLAVLAPRPADEKRQTTTSRATTGDLEPQPAQHGELLQRRVEIVESNAGLSARPDEIDAEIGDQLALEVAVPRAITLEAPSLGLVETAVPGAPARFDIFLSEPGQHRIADAATGRGLIAIVALGKSGAGARANPQEVQSR